MNKRFIAIITICSYFIQLFVWVPDVVRASNILPVDGNVVDAQYKEQKQALEAKNSGESGETDWSSDLVKQVKNLELGVDRSSFVISQDPTLTLRYKPSILDQVTDLFQKQAPLEKRVSVMVRNSDGEKIPETSVHVVEKDAGSVEIVVDKAALVPDIYSVEVLDNKSTFIVQNFSWGVLAINTNKSTYLPGDTVDFAMAVLDNDGEMVCNANVDLTITSPSGVATRLSSEEGGIIVNEDVCQSKDFTLTPDYEASFRTTEQGTYSLSLSAQTQFGTYKISDHFQVQSTVRFDVERISATRLYPVHQYPVLFRVTPTSDYKGPVTEQVPSNFVVLPLSASDAKEYTDVTADSYQRSFVVSQGESSQSLTWNVDWKAGKTYVVGYQFDAPDESPEFYTLGTLAIGSEIVETRAWQLAIDFVSLLTAVETAATTISEELNSNGHNMVFIDDQTGYMIYNDAANASYRKTTNAGVTWGSEVALTAQGDIDNVVVWYDRWTPGNTGDLIHIAFLEAGGDDVYYNYIDTANSDTQKGEVLAVARSTTTHTSLTDSISITRATDGDLYIAASSSVASSVPIVRKSTDVGDNWTDTADEGMDVAADPVMLMPLASADILILRWDISADDIQSKEYDEGADTWTANWTDNNVDTDAIDSTVFTETWSATVHPTTNDIYLAYVNTPGVVTTPEIRAAQYNGSSWTAKPDVAVDTTGTTSIMGVTIGLDSLTDDVYVAYIWGTSASVNRTYYQVSSDFTAGSPTWSNGRGTITNVGDDLKAIHMDAVSNTQLGMWVYNDDTQDIWYGQIADLGAHAGVNNLTNFNGFESQNSIDSNSTVGTTSYSTSVFRSGDAGLRTNPTSGTGYVTHALTYALTGAVTSTDIDNISGLVAMRIASGTNISQNTVVITGLGGNVAEFTVTLNTDQTLSITNDSAVNGSYALVDDTWYVIAFGSTSVDLPNAQEVQIYSSDMSVLHETILQTGQTVADFDQIRMGVQTAGTTADIYWDDFAVFAENQVWNFPLMRTDYRIAHAALDGTGTDTAWTNTYTNLDEIPTNNADYIESTTAGEDETSTLESASSAGVDGTIIAVRVMNLVWEASANTSSVRTIRTIASVTDETNAVDPGTNAGTDFVEVYTVQPNTALLWTTAAFDSLEVGVGNDASTTIRNGANVTQVLYEAPQTTTITISGSANGNDGATVMVAVEGSVQAQTDTIASSAWEITGVDVPTADDIITVWVDNVSDANETTAVTKWSAGDVTGMVLDTNVVSLGSNQDTSLTVTELNTYDCTEDEDVMHQAASSHLKVEGDACAGSITNSYSAEEIEILSGDTLTVGGSETLTTYDMTITGTLTSGGSSIYNVARNWANTGTFTSSTSTVNLTGADSSTQTISGSTSFTNLTISTSANSAGRTITHTAGTTQSVTGTWTVTGFSGKVITLGSSTTSAWSINPTAASVTYASISYSTNTGVAFCAINSTNGGNNTAWNISSGAICQDAANSFQRKTWYDGTRYWRSSRDSGNARIIFEYSTDGTSWTENTGARISVDTTDFSLWADSSNAFISYTNGYDIETREASTYPGTSFTWGSATVVYNGTGATDYYRYPTITQDSDSKIWTSASYSSSGVIDAQVSANDEDAEEQGNNTNFTITPLGDLLHLQTHQFDPKMVGTYFGNIAIPQGVTISSAYTEFNISSASQDDCYYNIYANDVDNSNDFTAEADVISRTPTTANVQVTADAVGTGWYGSAHDISTVIQEVIDRGGWSSGNAITLLFAPQDYASVGTRDCWFTDYNSSAANAPKLHIEYSTNQILAARSTSALDITAWDAPDVLDDATSADQYSTVVPRASSAAYAVWMDGTTIEGKNYNGSTWDGSPTTIDTGLTGLADTFSAVSDSSGNVHLLYISDETTDQVSHSKFNGTSWSSPALVADAADANDSYPTLTLDTTNNDLYAFWVDTSSSDIYYSVCDTTTNCDDAGEWGAEVAWQTSGTNTAVSSNFSGAALLFAQWYTGTGIDWDIIVLGGNTAPGAPTVLYVNERATTAQSGVANPVGVGDQTPVFSAIYNDDDSGDIADKYQVVVYSDVSCTAEVWNSGGTGTAMTNCTQGNRCADVTFGGSNIALDGATYYWKIKFWDDSDEAGTFSDCSATVTMVGPADQMRHGNYFFNQSVERTFTW